MKKTILFIAILTFLTSILSIKIFAGSFDDYYSQIKIPDDISPFVDIEDGIYTFTFSDTVRYIRKCMRSYLIEPLEMTLALLVIICICAVYHNFSHLLQKQKMECAFTFVVNMLSSFYIFYISADCISLSEKFVSRIADFSASLSPVICGISVSLGKINTSTVLSSGISLFCGLCEGVFVLFLFPLIRIMLVIGFLKGANNTVDMSGVLMILRRVYTTVLALVITFYSCILGTQKMSAVALDSVSYRSIRFAISSIVPVVGATLGEASRAVGASLTLLKDSIGAIGILVVVLLVLPCIVRIVIQRILLYVCAAFARILSCTKEADVIESVAGAWGYCLSLVVCSAFMLILVLSVFSVISVS